ncbi:MAG: cation transporter, partial [Acidimicrobiia bacterium]|nr:cation transporter [Acidimicrobiia bacterium]
AILEGYERLRHPEHHEGGIVLNLVVLGLAAFFEIVIAFRPALEEFNRRRRGRGAWRTIRESKDPTLVVVLFEDTVAVLGVFIAAAGLILAEVTGASQWDGAASIVIGIMLTATAWLLALETKGLLLGESASRRTRSEIRGAILSLGSVETVERLMTMHLGSEEILVNVDVTVEDGFSGDQVEGVVADIEEAIRSVVPEATRIFVEVGADS